jgi:pyruvate/2-oxoglutarate dehydrogenase complex dihydrolipoamide dehydrogenase (E3) component
VNPPQSYESVLLGCGKSGKTLAIELGNIGVKTALIERSAGMIGGGCINVGCIPTKTLMIGDPTNNYIGVLLQALTAWT